MDVSSADAERDGTPLPLRIPAAVTDRRYNQTGAADFCISDPAESGEKPIKLRKWDVDF